MLLIENLTIENRKIKIIRDDVFPFPGGGNKARKAIEYERYFKENKVNAIVTTGGIQSNHCRAMAILASKNKWKCHLVFHGTKEKFFQEKGNALLVRNTNATCEFVTPSEISQAMDNAMANYKSQGLNPYYVTGGGHDIPGGIAYVKAIKDLKVYSDESNWKPDIIFLASGTGSTQSGILVGLNLIGWQDVKVIGISIAREKVRGASVIKTYTEMLSKKLNISDNWNKKINLIDDFLYGGYEQTIPEMENWLHLIMKDTGILFDSTYSGKALWGMYNLMQSIDQEKNILFWHTGGIMNLLK